MTIKEAFIVGLGGLTVSSGLIDRSLLQAKISDSSTLYEPNLHDSMIEVAEMQVLYAYWGGLKSISEGDMSEVYDTENRLKRLLYLAKKYGREDIIEALDDKPRIKRLRMW